MENVDKKNGGDLWVKAKIDGSPISSNMEDKDRAERLAVMGAMMCGSLAAMVEDGDTGDAKVTVRMKGGVFSVRFSGEFLMIKYIPAEKERNYTAETDHKLNIPSLDEPV